MANDVQERCQRIWTELYNDWDAHWLRHQGPRFQWARREIAEGVRELLGTHGILTGVDALQHALRALPRQAKRIADIEQQLGWVVIRLRVAAPWTAIEPILGLPRKQLLAMTYRGQHPADNYGGRRLRKVAGDEGATLIYAYEAAWVRRYELAVQEALEALIDHLTAETVAAGTTQSDLARITGLTRNQIRTRLERAKNPPPTTLDQCSCGGTASLHHEEDARPWLVPDTGLAPVLHAVPAR